MAQYSILQKKEIQILLDQYDIKVNHFSTILGGAGNSSYLINSNNQDYILTICEFHISHAISLCNLLEYLEKHDFPSTRITKSSNGKTCLTFQGKPVLLKPYIHGNVIQNLNRPMIRQVGKALGKLHEIPSPNNLDKIHSYGLEIFSKCFEKSIDPIYEKWLVEKHNWLKKEIPPSLPKGLIHGDLFYDNVLFEKNKFKAIIDFEEACHYYKVFDLGMAALGLCTINFKIDLKKVRALIEGYQKIRILETEEKETLQLMIDYAATATSFWRFWKYNIELPMKNKSKKHMEMVRISHHVNSISPTEFQKIIF